MKRLSAVLTLLLLAACGGSSDPGQAALEAEFERSMRNVVLDGAFTVTGRGDNTRMRQERYEIEKAVKLAGDIWTIHARIVYGEHDIVAPVPVKLLWAGDTPMISLTDLSIPGLGSDFTARVLFYRDHYAGLWWHGKTGGQMFGVLSRGEAAPSDTPAPAE